MLKRKDPVNLTDQEKNELYDFIKNYKLISQPFIDKYDSSFYKQVWMRASGAKSQIHANPGYYQSLKKAQLLYPNPDFEQIELDVTRTFPHIRDKDKREEKENQLRNVLNTYLKRNAKVGYFQGLNYIAGNLLTCLNEEEAFWVTCMIIEKYFPLDYYSNFFGVLAD